MKMPIRIVLTLILSSLTFSAFAVDPINKSLIGGVAIKGFDPVAYFTDGKAVKGSGDFEHEFMDATWRFSSAAHRDAFARDPKKYVPQYGGYCAYGVSRGYAVGVDPEAWKVVGGKLYLNYNAEVQKMWLEDVPGRVKRADENWPKILRE